MRALGWIAQREAGQQAVTLDRMQIARDAMADVIKGGGGRSRTLPES